MTDEQKTRSNLMFSSGIRDRLGQEGTLEPTFPGLPGHDTQQLYLRRTVRSTVRWDSSDTDLLVPSLQSSARRYHT